MIALTVGAMGRSEIAEAVGHERISGAVNRAIKELLLKGLITHTIPDKPNSRMQKYRLTAKGKAWLESQTKSESP